MPWVDEHADEWTLHESESRWTLVGDVCGDLNVHLDAERMKVAPGQEFPGPDSGCSAEDAAVRSWIIDTVRDPDGSWGYDSTLLTIKSGERFIAFGISTR
jgi:hypothetical protein